MKSFMVFGLLASLVVITYFKGVEANGMVKKFAQRCKDREGASDADVDGLMKLQIPESKVQKCFVDCMYQQIGFSDGRTFRKEGFLRHSKRIVGDSEEKQKMAKEIAEECSAVSNSDKCELAADIVKCVKNGLQSRGLGRN